MIELNWQLKNPIDAIVFDCDGTLTEIEGIDELARNNGVGDVVAALTEEAMSQTGLNADLYKQRLDLVRPTQAQVLALGQKYYERRIIDVDQVIAILQKLNKSVYIISAGLLPAVSYFGNLLHVPTQNIFAVNIQFDSRGHFSAFDDTSPFVTVSGKRVIVNELKKLHSTIAYTGDGLNDYEVYDLVTRFVGFGGAFYRDNIASRCSYYISTLSMAPILPLLLTQQEYSELFPGEKKLYERGLMLLMKGAS